MNPRIHTAAGSRIVRTNNPAPASSRTLNPTCSNDNHPPEAQRSARRRRSLLLQRSSQCRVVSQLRSPGARLNSTLTTSRNRKVERQQPPIERRRKRQSHVSGSILPHQQRARRWAQAPTPPPRPATPISKPSSRHLLHNPSRVRSQRVPQRKLLHPRRRSHQQQTRHIHRGNQQHQHTPSPSPHISGSCRVPRLYEIPVDPGCTWQLAPRQKLIHKPSATASPAPSTHPPAAHATAEPAPPAPAPASRPASTAQRYSSTGPCDSANDLLLPGVTMLQHRHRHKHIRNLSPHRTLKLRCRTLPQSGNGCSVDR